MEALIEDSKERRDCIQKKWNKYSKRATGSGETSLAIKEETLKKWVKTYPIMNECSHFACILDPKTGQIRWLERGVIEMDGG
jgi:hypothetical protein